MLATHSHQKGWISSGFKDYWAVAGEFSSGGKPILANDPHLEATLLPGPWYPCGLITPQLRAVGVNIPGMAGMPIGRIPWEQMPHTRNPARGWLGTCNHLTVKRDFPYHYASAIASSHRY